MDETRLLVISRVRLPAHQLAVGCRDQLLGPRGRVPFVVQMDSGQSPSLNPYRYFNAQVILRGCADYVLTRRQSYSARRLFIVPARIAHVGDQLPVCSKHTIICVLVPDGFTAALTLTVAFLIQPGEDL